MKMTKNTHSGPHLGALRWRGGQPKSAKETGANLTAGTGAPSTNSRTWPINPATGQPLPPQAQPGYYPGFETLSQQAFWDSATRKVVLDRVNNHPPIQFFTPDEVLLMQALADRIIPQDDRDAAHRIPIVEVIDARLHSGRIDGYRFEDMPSDAEAHRLGLQGIAAIAHETYSKPFEQLDPLEQDAILKDLHDGKAAAGKEIWQRVPVNRYWMLLEQDCIEAYYAHPYAWDEIGFGGPSYPRGYFRLEGGRPEPWEVEEHRYAWEPPATSLSGENTPIGGKELMPHPESQSSGQEGAN